jgi:hypothetical protein
MNHNVVLELVFLASEVLIRIGSIFKRLLDVSPFAIYGEITAVSNQPPVAWTALKNAIGSENCPKWMYMNTYHFNGHMTVHAYKHSASREYICFSDDGCSWNFYKDSFRPTWRKNVIQYCVRLTKAFNH